MDSVKRAILRLLAITGAAAVIGFALHAVHPPLGQLVTPTIGWGIVLLSVGVLILVMKTTAAQFPAGENDLDDAFGSQRLMACSLVCYVVGVPITLGFHLTGMLPVIGAVLYVAPLAVAVAMAYGARHARRA